MRNAVMLVALLALGGCKTASEFVTCENALLVRAAAEKTVDAIDAACGFEQPALPEGEQ